MACLVNASSLAFQFRSDDVLTADLWNWHACDSAHLHSMSPNLPAAGMRTFWGRAGACRSELYRGRMVAGSEVWLSSNDPQAVKAPPGVSVQTSTKAPLTEVARGPVRGGGRGEDAAPHRRVSAGPGRDRHEPGGDAHGPATAVTPRTTSLPERVELGERTV